MGVGGQGLERRRLRQSLRLDQGLSGTSWSQVFGTVASGLEMGQAEVSSGLRVESDWPMARLCMNSGMWRAGDSYGRVQKWELSWLE